MSIDWSDPVVCFNVVEAIWWIALGLLIAFSNLGITGLRGWPRHGLIVAFLCFGVSDLIETQTGAWWRPVGLMLLKIGCIVMFIACVVQIALGERRAKANSESADPSQ